jgi:hypothetical protein
MSEIWILAVAAGIGVAAWKWMRSRAPHVPPELLDPNIDFDELQEAEEEVQDLDAFATPEEADEQLPDWGPGAPKR